MKASLLRSFLRLMSSIAALASTSPVLAQDASGEVESGASPLPEGREPEGSAETASAGPGLVETESAEPALVETESAEPATAATALSEWDPALRAVETWQGPEGLSVVHQFLEPSPEVSVCTALDAGTRHDDPDAPGVHRVLAQMLESGGYRSRDGSYSRLVEDRGGHNWMSAQVDAVIFCTTVPSSELELALWVAGSRFSGHALTQERLERAVQELARQSEERDQDVLLGRAPDRVRRMALLGAPRWARSDLASPEQFDAVTLEQVRAAHEQAYVGRRARLAVVGGGSTEALRAGVGEYFGALRAGEVSTFEAALVPQHTTRFSMDEDRTAKDPAAWYAWVARGERQRSALNAALDILLFDGRLGSRLLDGARPARSFELELAPATKGPALARLRVEGRGSRSLGVIEKQLDEQVARLADSGPTTQEWEELVDQRRKRQRSALLTGRDRARALSVQTLFGTPAEEVLAPLDEEFVPDVPSTAQIQQAARELLAPHRRAMVEVYPKGWQDPWQAPMPLFHIVQSGQTLGAIAHRYGTSVAVIEKMNGISRSRPIYPGDKLKVPRGKVKKERPLRTHQVRRGDTLSALALKYGVSVRAIADANGMGSRQTIRTGESLNIPWPSGGGASETSTGKESASGSSSSAGSQGTHVVQSGETLSGIALRFGVSTAALAQANGISSSAMVRVGQELTLPPRGTGKPSAAVDKIHVVASGDTLSGIAKKYGVTVAAITVANRMSRKATLRPGQRLKIPSSE